MTRKQTRHIPLSGGQDRLRQMILYVAQKNTTAAAFGRTKLNKILWRADFVSYADRGVPVTGREYQRLEHGPAPKEMLPLYREMKLAGFIDEETTDFGEGVREFRPIAKRDPDLSKFDVDDLRYVDDSINYYWETGRETSDDSHGAAWRSRHDGDLMPYESALLDDAKPTPAQISRLKSIIDEQGAISR